MRMALTVWGNKISPVFDSARRLLIVDVEKGVVIRRHHEFFHSELPYNRAAMLFDLRAKVLICGAISQIFANVIEAYGIKIVPFVTGDVDQVLNHYLKGAPFTAHFYMPGCGHKGRRLRSRRGRGYLKICNKERR
ncbi:MAG: NifB/NifX family molybdenum-iron cluster-binding protein [bacterium]